MSGAEQQDDLGERSMRMIREHDAEISAAVKRLITELHGFAQRYEVPLPAVIVWALGKALFALNREVPKLNALEGIRLVYDTHEQQVARGAMSTTNIEYAKQPKPEDVS